MDIVCAWCKKDMGSKPSVKYPERFVTHGICDECTAGLLRPIEPTLMGYLDNLGVPVLVVGADVVVDYANKHSRELLQKEMPKIEGLRGGDVFECAHSRLPGGCGKTIHCIGCAIRNTITDTYSTGISHLRTPAYLIQGTPDDNHEVKFLISTEKAGEVVLLRIDEVGEH